MSLAERTFSTEIDEQLASDIIQYARRLYNRYTTLQPAPNKLNADREQVTEVDVPSHSLPVDTKVIIWSDTAPKARRYFSHFNSSGEIECFVNGMTSWATKQTMNWPYWELAE